MAATEGQSPPTVKRSLPRRLALSLLRVAVVTYLGLILVLYFFQSVFIYQPTRGIWDTPAKLRLPYDNVWFDGDSGARINGWYVPGVAGAPTVLFCHPNAGSMSSYLETIGMMHGLGLNVLIFDYRGYGRSTGKLGEVGTYADAEAAWRWLEQNHKPTALIIWGRSLGGAMAARLAAEHAPQALVLESTFSSFPAVAHDFFPYVPVSLIARYHYPTADDAAQVKCPTLVIHSPDDEVVNFRHGQIIYDRLTCPKQFLQITGSHNEGFTLTGLSYENGIRKFFQQYRIWP